MLDYQTIHIIPNTSAINVGATEPIIITATSSSTIDCIVQSLSYPKDIIYYSITNNNSIVNGSTKGYIYRRIDTVQNNDLPFDFREVKFRRWQLNVTTQDATGAVSNYTTGDVVKKTSTNEIYIKSINANNVDIVWTMSITKWKILTEQKSDNRAPIGANNQVELNFNLSFNQTYILVGQRIIEGRIKFISTKVSGNDESDNDRSSEN